MALKAAHVSDVPNLALVHENAALSLCSTRFAAHVSDVPNLDLVPENAALSLCSTRFAAPELGQESKEGFKFTRFVVMGHRGYGMNMLQASDRRMKSIKENSILSFNYASKLPIDFIEFDVQVTKDDCAVIFHDNFILTQHKGDFVEKRITDLTLAEFLSYGPQNETGICVRKVPLFRKTKDGRIFEWKVEEDDPLCTLQEVFQKVDSSMGFNIELKFDDQLAYTQEKLAHVLQVVLQVVFEHDKDRVRPIIFSSFQPDAAQMMRKLQGIYPVFFLTNGGSEIFTDTRRNSLDEAIKVCIEGGLQGIVSEVKAIFRNPGAVTRIKESKLSLISYGQLNNVPELVCMQHMMGVEGVIVDMVQEITEAVSDISDTAAINEQVEDLSLFWEDRKMKLETNTPGFLRDELSLVLKLIPELIRARNQ